MKTLLILLLTLAAVTAGAQSVPYYPATQAEVNRGTDKRRGVTPFTLQNATLTNLTLSYSSWTNGATVRGDFTLSWNSFSGTNGITLFYVLFKNGIEDGVYWGDHNMDFHSIRIGSKPGSPDPRFTLAFLDEFDEETITTYSFYTNKIGLRWQGSDPYNFIQLLFPSNSVFGVTNLGTVLVGTQIVAKVGANTLIVRSNSASIGTDFTALGALAGSSVTIGGQGNLNGDGSGNIGSFTVDGDGNAKVGGLLAVVASATITNGLFSVAQINTTAGTANNWASNNLYAGRVRISAGQQTYFLTNAAVTASSVVIATVSTDDTTALNCKAIPASGLLTLKLNAAATANTDICWSILSTSP